MLMINGALTFVGLYLVALGRDGKKSLCSES